MLSFPSWPRVCCGHDLLLDLTTSLLLLYLSCEKDTELLVCTTWCTHRITMRIWARILKHSMRAVKSTFRGELSFQRSECTAGLTVATSFCAAYKDCFVKTFQKTLELIKWSTFAFCIEKAYLETLHSHFHPNCHFKMFKNSGSGQKKFCSTDNDDDVFCSYLCLVYGHVLVVCALARVGVNASFSRSACMGRVIIFCFGLFLKIETIFFGSFRNVLSSPITQLLFSRSKLKSLLVDRDKIFRDGRPGCRFGSDVTESAPNFLNLGLNVLFEQNIDELLNKIYLIQIKS